MKRVLQAATIVGFVLGVPYTLYAEESASSSSLTAEEAALEESSQGADLDLVNEGAALVDRDPGRRGGRGDGRGGRGDDVGDGDRRDGNRNDGRWGRGPGRYPIPGRYPNRYPNRYPVRYPTTRVFYQCTAYGIQYEAHGGHTSTAWLHASAYNTSLAACQRVHGQCYVRCYTRYAY